jgi:hypothetical protein
MTRKAILPLLGLAVAMIFASPTKASAEVFVGVNIGPVVPRPGYVVVAPGPYAYRYYGPRVVAAPVVVRPGYFYHGRWYPRYYARRYYGPRYFRR